MKNFRNCWVEIPSYTDRSAFISDLVLSEIWGDAPESEVPVARVELLGEIWDVYHGGVPELLRQTGLTQRGLAARFGISPRTVQGWCCTGGVNARKCPDYVLMMMAEILLSE